jgi:hypothetical protein
MRKLWYVGLESYVARYTHQLTQWNVEVFTRRGINYDLVLGDRIGDEQINVGSVLDAHGRTHYSLTQNATLVRKLASGEITGADTVFYEDMYTPGIDALPYIFDQIPESQRPRVFFRCLAQTIDPDDFVHRTGMFPWMRRYEQIADHIASKYRGGILVASEEMVPNLRIAEFKAPIYVTGLPFGKAEVQRRMEPEPWHERTNRVVFAARWDSEKQPDFFLDLARKYFEFDPEIRFTVLTGHKELKSNDPALLDRLHKAVESKDCNVGLSEGLSKNEYYAYLADSKVLFNCALQDWVSNTVSEADALGCFPIYPAYRSFPEVFSNNPAHMYLPWSLDDAMRKITLVMQKRQAPKLGAISDYQDGTIDRTLDVFQRKGNSVELERLEQHKGYRRYVAIPKYKVE